MHQPTKYIRIRGQSGYSLFEMIIVIIILGILTAITMSSLKGANQVVRVEETRAEMDRLAWAIAGNPDQSAGGSRADFGYIGDIGSMPPNLAALVINPGLATWHGPYIRDEFLAGVGASDNSYALDAWGNAYSYTGVSITSSGGGTPLTRQLAPSTDDLLRNMVTLSLRDLSSALPGATYHDSLRLLLTIPDGIGGTTTRVEIPQPNGYAAFDSIPIGSHLLRLVYLPTADTLQRQVSVDPGQHVHVDWQYPEEIW